MGEKKKEQWFTIIAIVVPVLVSVIALGGVMYSRQNVIITKQDTHFVASELHEEKQDGRINGNTTGIRVNTDAIGENRLQIAKLGPAAQEAEVQRVIAQVQDQIDCKMISDNVSGWLCVSAASSDYLPDELRVRVEEHFRKLGYEVSRQKQLPGGQWRGFWILVEQS